ncbi:LAFA_0E19526g1_1 [Lachancea sp. 'fantastica']|nr:LAFA_0E19526g1_1 [Lachancea sp. 'fantastica']
MALKTSIESQNVVADYFLVFNNEIRRFLDPLWCKSQLSSSYVHVNSKVKWLSMGVTERESADFSDVENNDDEEEEEEEEFGKVEGNYQGVFWSCEEKEVFFHYLSRASIHGLENWAHFLPRKSKFEIMAYYEVLRRNLEELKGLNSKRHGGILTKMEFPIAYEMDEFFVALEEDVGQQVDKELQQEQQRAAEENAGSDLPDQLIDLENWSKRWNPIYSKTGVEELQPAPKTALPFSSESLLFLEKCVELQLRRILLYTVLPNLDRKHVPRSNLLKDKPFRHSKHPEEPDELVVTGEFQSAFPHVVSEEDVWKGLATMRQEGLAAPSLAESVLTTLRKFKLKHKEGRIFKTHRTAMGVVPRILAHAEAVHDLENSRKEQKLKEEPHPEIFAHIHQKLFQLNSKRKDEQSFIPEDKFDQINNPLEQKLCDLELFKLEQHDIHLSKQYQHALLVFMQGKNKPTQPLALNVCDDRLDEATIPEAIQHEFQYE